MNVRPHPGLLPQEKEKHPPVFGDADAPGSRAVFPAKEKETALTRGAAEFSRDAQNFSLSPGERVRVRASVKTILCFTLLFCLITTSSLFAQNTITNFISPVVSYQYYDALGTDTNSKIFSLPVSYQFYDSLEHAGTNSMIISPVASYQYFDWPDASSVHFINSPLVSYFFQIGNGVPFIVVQPKDQLVQSGATATFAVLADGQAPLSYQWLHVGQNMTGENNATLVVTSVQWPKAGAFSVVVSSPYGSVTSATASLKLLADPANGKPTAQIVAPFCPVPPVNVDSLVFVTHGVEPPGFDDISWITNMANAIRAKVPSNWEVRTLDWRAVSHVTEPTAASIAGTIGGHLYGSQLAQQRYWKHVHLIGHSAGASVIEAIASELKASPTPPLIIHETFLDPFIGYLHEWRFDFGSHSDWSDSYFALNLSSVATGGRLPNCHNVDVTWLDTAHISYVTNYCYASDPFGNSTPPAVFETQVPCSVRAYVSSSHGWPHDFYQASINNGPPGAAGYGFPLSEEVNGWNNLASYTNDNPPVVLNGQLAQPRNVMPIHINPLLQFGNFPNASAGAVKIGNLNLNLSSSYSLPFISPSGIHPLGGASTNIPAWISVGLTITNPVNFVQFDAAFTSVNAEGLLTTYWDTNQVGMVDERVASINLQTYQFVLPATVTNGVYVLGFRLDSFNGTSSSITITNVATGFVGVDQPITLSVALFTNNTPVLQLTGASNYNYLVESSTNLVDWTPTALLVNLNGTVFFADKTATNTPARFYRALMP